MKKKRLIIYAIAILLLFAFAGYGIRNYVSELNTQEKLRQEQAIKTAVFKRKIVKHTWAISAPTQLFYLEDEDGNDPSAEVMRTLLIELKDCPFPILKRSDSRLDKDGDVVGKKTGQKGGVRIKILRIEWVTDNQVKVTLSIYEGRTAGGAYLYQLERKEKEWVIIKESLISVS